MIEEPITDLLRIEVRGERRAVPLVLSRRLRAGQFERDEAGWTFAAPEGLSAYLLEAGNSAKPERPPESHAFSFYAGETLHLQIASKGAILTQPCDVVLTLYDLAGTLSAKHAFRLRNGRREHVLACPPVPGRGAVAVRLRGSGRLAPIRVVLAPPGQLGAPVAPPALFDAAHYAAQAGIGSDREQAWADYRARGEGLGYTPHPWFDPTWFRARYMTKRQKAQNALVDFVARAREEPVRPHPLFQSDWYRENYGLPAGIVPVEDFLIQAGARAPNQASWTAGGPAAANPPTAAVPAAIARGRPLSKMPIQPDPVERQAMRKADPATMMPRVAVFVLCDRFDAETATALASLNDQTSLGWHAFIVSDDPIGGPAAAAGLRSARVLVADPRHSWAAIGSVIAQIDTPVCAFLRPGWTWAADFLADMAAGLLEGPAAARHCTVEVLRPGAPARFTGPTPSRNGQLLHGQIPLSALLIERELLADLLRQPPEDGGKLDEDEIVAGLIERDALGWLPSILCTEHVRPTAPDVGQDRAALDRLALIGRRLLDWPGDARVERLDLSIVFHARGVLRPLFDSLQALLRRKLECSHEILIVEDGAAAVDLDLLWEWERLFPQVRILRTPRRFDQALSWNVGGAAARGRQLLFLSAGVVADPADVNSLAKSSATVEPQVEFGEGDRLLFDPADIRPGGPDNLCLVVPRTEFVRLRGFDPGLTDGPFVRDFRMRSTATETLAPPQDHPSGARLHRLAQPAQIASSAAWAQFRARWPQDGWAANARGNDRSAATASTAPALSFAIKVCIGGEPDANSGDLHFAMALARSLRALGHGCRVDRTADWYRHASADDVVIVLRGRFNYRPCAGHRNLLWVISHPAEVGAIELAAYDHAFAASDRLASWLRAFGTDTPVTTLRQCTDPDLFFPPPAPDAAPNRLLFVGNSRKVDRPIVAAAARERLPLELYGQHWDGFAAAPLVRGTSIANEALGEAYRGSVVLNDHWADMRDAAILSNRLFDACACACPVISDAVAEMGDVFGELVIPFEEGAPLGPLVAKAFTEPPERRAARHRLAEEIRRQHSFAARAAEIAACASNLLAQAG